MIRPLLIVPFTLVTASALAFPLPSRPRWPVAFEMPPIPTVFTIMNPDAPVAIGCTGPITRTLWGEPTYSAPNEVESPVAAAQIQAPQPLRPFPLTANSVGARRLGLYLFQVSR